MSLFNFKNTYVNLGSDFIQRIAPTPVKSPSIVLYNELLADDLYINRADLSQKELAAILAGNKLPDGAEPLAMAYAGHQFGYFAKLGDGRAHLLGEHLTPSNQRFDIQLKGAGPTAFSRRGDGRATLYAMLREYLMGEAMHALGIPSSRSLAVVETGEIVYRETPQKGAVLTRVMESHLRVGTFEYAKRFLDKQRLTQLLDYAIERHYPELADVENKALQFIEAVMTKQIDLVVNWMRVGFIHGVMNTDNMSICGQTFDYGPCAFMNKYDPATVFSSIDSQGRYAFGNQPGIAHWNITVLAGTLLPLVDEVQEKGVEKAQALIDEFPKRFDEKYYQMMGRKLGITCKGEVDNALIDDLLHMMRLFGWDYTTTFRSISTGKFSEEYSSDRFENWYKKWQHRVSLEADPDKSLAEMDKMNPFYIPRNHLVEEALDKAVEGDMSGFNELSEVLANPYQEQTGKEKFTKVPDDFDKGYQTFCGT